MDITSYLLGKNAGGGGSATLQTKEVTITENGETNITPDTGYDGLSKVELTTNVQPDLESKSVTITENTTTTITPSQDKDGISSVEVITNVPQGITPTGTISITENGTVDVTNYASANVNVSGDISDYFKDTISYGSNANNPGWFNVIKKIPAMTISGTSCSRMFQNFKGSEIDLSSFNTSSVTNMSYMFTSCENLTGIDVSTFNTANVTDMSYMFQSVYNKSWKNTLNLSNFDFSKVENVTMMFQSCGYLVNLTWGSNYGKGFTVNANYNSNYTLNLGQSPNLSHDSLMSVINNLYDLNLTYNVAGGGTLYRQYLTIGATNLAKLSSAEIQIATDKGWDVN